MSKTFELETLRIRMNDAEFQLLDLHQRVQRAMRELILDGALPPGLKLPATRSLAESLGIARDTVENAYMQLHRDGFIVRQQGSSRRLTWMHKVSARICCEQTAVARLVCT